MSRRASSPLAEQVERLFLLLLRQRGESAEADQPALTNTQRLALFTVASGQRLRLGTLAELMGTTNATASRTVDGLVSLGLVRREPDPIDGRGVVVVATPEASTLVASRRRRMTRALELGRGQLEPGEEERLVALLAHLNDVLEREAAGVARAAAPATVRP